jgi:dTDP-4-dehydrorhamnose 3,5-epimerase-like enzyme
MTAEIGTGFRIEASEAIPGLVQVFPVDHVDERGRFIETFNRRSLAAAGFEVDFHPVQGNRSDNAGPVTRGIHAEPWNKYISLAVGEAFAAIVDLRPTDNFGRVETFHLTATNCLFVPRGLGNSYQTLTDITAYTYLVDAHYDMGLAGRYPAVNILDPDLAIDWPLDPHDTSISAKDLANPSLQEARQLLASVALIESGNNS